MMDSLAREFGEAVAEFAAAMGNPSLGLKKVAENTALELVAAMGSLSLDLKKAAGNPKRVAA